MSGSGRKTSTSEYLHLCTDTHSWAVRQVSTSNSVFVVEPTMGSVAGSDTISSDAYGSFKSLHDDSTLTYSLCGAVSKLLALGLDLENAIAAVTVNPARVLNAETELGTLKVGSIADISILQLVEGDWYFFDALEEKLSAKQKLIPVGVVRSREFIHSSCRLLRDLVAIAS